MDAANQRLLDQTMIALDARQQGKLGANAFWPFHGRARRGQTLEVPLYATWAA